MCRAPLFGQSNGFTANASKVPGAGSDRIALDRHKMDMEHGRGLCGKKQARAALVLEDGRLEIWWGGGMQTRWEEGAGLEGLGGGGGSNTNDWRSEREAKLILIGAS